MTQQFGFLEQRLKRAERARSAFNRLDQAVPQPGQPPVQQPQAEEAPRPTEMPQITPEMLTRKATSAPIAPPPDLDLADVAMPPLSPELRAPDWTDKFYQREGRLPSASDAALRNLQERFESINNRPPTRNELIMSIIQSLGVEPQLEEL